MSTVEAGVTRLQLARGPAQHRAHVPHRSRRGRDARRDGRDAGLRHDRGSLRHDARERARPHRGPRRRQGHQDRNARAKVGGGLRPDAPVRRLRGHARHHHRGDAPAASGARSGVRGGLLVRLDAGRGRYRDRHHPAGRAGRAHRAARRNADGRDQPLLEDWNTPIAPTLLFEFHGDSEDHVARQAETVEALATERGGHRFEWATRLEDRERLWQARHNAHYAGLALRPGCRSWATDVCVPISRLADCVVETEKETRHASFPVCLVGHAGDGNFHLMYLLNPDDPAEVAEAQTPERTARAPAPWHWAAPARASTASDTAR